MVCSQCVCSQCVCSQCVCSQGCTGIVLATTINEGPAAAGVNPAAGAEGFHRPQNALYRLQKALTGCKTLLLAVKRFLLLPARSLLACWSDGSGGDSDAPL
jgi:hypothetical protein